MNNSIEPVFGMLVRNRGSDSLDSLLKDANITYNLHTPVDLNVLMRQKMFQQSGKPVMQRCLSQDWKWKLAGLLIRSLTNKHPLLRIYVSLTRIQPYFLIAN